MIDFRQATMADAKNIAQLIRHTWPDEAKRFAHEFKLIIKNPRVYAACCFVAETQHEIIGVVFVYKANMAFDLLSLDWLAVQPQAQGRGIGAELVKLGCAVGQARGQKIAVSTDKPQFFEKLGFKNLGQYSKNYWMLIWGS